MASHFMMCVVEAPFTRVFEALRLRFGNIYRQTFSLRDEPSVGVVLGEQYFFRVNSDVAITILLEVRGCGKN